MKAVDTNVLARYVIGDDPVQSPLAAKTLSQPCYVSDTILIETAWLLSSRFGLDRADLAATLNDLVSLPALTVGEPDLIAWAIARFADGADFADMMHLIGGRHADAFVSFKTKLAKQAGPDAPVPIERPA